MKAAEDWIPTRQSLLSRLRDWEDAASWEDFFQTYWKLIYRVARQSGLSDAEAQDVVQETVITVARQMPKFNYDRSRGTFKGWLLRTTQWRISDQFRRRRGHVPLEGGSEGQMPSDLVEGAPEGRVEPQVEASWDQLWREQMLEVAWDRVRKHADAKDCLIFDQLIGQGRDAATVARMLQVSRARVYYAKYKIARLVESEVKKLKHDWGAD